MNLARGPFGLEGLERLDNTLFDPEDDLLPDLGPESSNPDDDYAFIMAASSLIPDVNALSTPNLTLVANTTATSDTLSDTTAIAELVPPPPTSTIVASTSNMLSDATGAVAPAPPHPAPMVVNNDDAAATPNLAPIQEADTTATSNMLSDITGAAEPAAPAPSPMAINIVNTAATLDLAPIHEPDITVRSNVLNNASSAATQAPLPPLIPIAVLSTKERPKPRPNGRAILEARARAELDARIASIATGAPPQEPTVQAPPPAEPSSIATISTTALSIDREWLPPNPTEPPKPRPNGRAILEARAKAEAKAKAEAMAATASMNSASTEKEVSSLVPTLSPPRPAPVAKHSNSSAVEDELIVEGSRKRTQTAFGKRHAEELAKKQEKAVERKGKSAAQKKTSGKAAKGNGSSKSKSRKK